MSKTLSNILTKPVLMLNLVHQIKTEVMSIFIPQTHTHFDIEFFLNMSALFLWFNHSYDIVYDL